MPLLDDWIEAYVAYTGAQESPEIFHRWIAVSTIAGVLQRKVHFDMGYFTLYPNMFIVLVSPPGRCKKSTAMRMGTSMARELKNVYYSPDSTSRESLIRDLSQNYRDGQSAISVVSSEFASMLTTSGIDMVVFLTDIFDSPANWIHKTKSGGADEIKAPFLNLLAGTTPDWISKAMPLDTVGIGLTSRVVFVYSNDPRQARSRPRLTPHQKRLGDMLLQDLAHIATLSGEYEYDSPETEEFFDLWYGLHRDRSSSTIDPRLSGYHERKPTHVTKLAMILSAATRRDMKITRPDIERAVTMLDEIEPDMRKVFAGVGKNPLAADLEDTLALFLRRSEGFTFDELWDRLRHSVRQEEMHEILNGLMVLKHVVRVGDRYYHSRLAPS